MLLKGFPDSSAGKESTSNAGDPTSIPGSGRPPGEGMGHPLQYSWASLVAQLVKNLQCGRPGFSPWVGKIPWRREQLSTPVFWPGEFYGWYSPWGDKELAGTEWLSLFYSKMFPVLVYTLFFSFPFFFQIDWDLKNSFLEVIHYPEFGGLFYPWILCER